MKQSAQRTSSGGAVISVKRVNSEHGERAAAPGIVIGQRRARCLRKVCLVLEQATGQISELITNYESKADTEDAVAKMTSASSVFDYFLNVKKTERPDQRCLSADYVRQLDRAVSKMKDVLNNKLKVLYPRAERVERGDGAHSSATDQSQVSSSPRPTLNSLASRPHLANRDSEGRTKAIADGAHHSKTLVKTLANQKILDARKLVKKALSSSSSANEPSKATIDTIFRASKSLPVFAKKLMRYFFKESELLECSNVYGRERLSRVITGRPLDPRRINRIRQHVQERSDYLSKTWYLCVSAMNTDIKKLKRRKLQDNKRDESSQIKPSDTVKHDAIAIPSKTPDLKHIKEEPSEIKPSNTIAFPAKKPELKENKEGLSENKPVNTIAFPKKTAELKESRFYQRYDLSFQEISEIYRESTSIPSFAKRLMQHLFSESELLGCYNVYGRFKSAKASPERALDKQRIDMIYHIIEENSDFSIQLWKECVSTMNHGISHLKKDHIQD